MERHRGKRFPIVEDGRLIGVVSRANLVQALASVDPRRRDDRAGQGDSHAIALAPRPAALDRLRRQKRDRLGRVVHLWGLVGSPAEPEALVALAAERPGVKRVADELLPAY